MSKRTIETIHQSVLIDILGFLTIGAIRFFLGRPMNGKQKDNSSFLKGATRGAPGKRLTRWQKKSHLKRSLVRQSVFWPVLMLVAIAILNWRVALLALVFLSPVLCVMIYPRMRLVFFQPFTSTDASSGQSVQHWILRDKYKGIFKQPKIPGYLGGPKQMIVEDELPPELRDAVIKDINLNENRGKTPVTSVRRMLPK